MKEYEVLVESIHPCGGDCHSKKEFLEITAESPEAYVKENAQWPVIDSTVNSDGDTVITTGDGNGYMTRYTFSE